MASRGGVRGGWRGQSQAGPCEAQRCRKNLGRPRGEQAAAKAESPAWPSSAGHSTRSEAEAGKILGWSTEEGRN